MSKVQLGPQRFSYYPMPVFLVGANVDDKPNFMTLCYGGAVNWYPPMVIIAMQDFKYTNKGIRQNKTFSVNLPTVDMVKETDYCGLNTGAKVNKVDACRFKVFYGKLQTAPMIEQCAVNLECKVMHMLHLGVQDLIVGKIEETHFSDNCLTDGKPDAARIKPLVYYADDHPRYRTLGDPIARAFSVGKELGK